jgi:hypothetical protein
VDSGERLSDTCVQQRPIAIGAIQQLSVWDQLAKVLQQLIEQAFRERCSAADGLTAADQHTKLPAAFELDQHLNRQQERTGVDGDCGIARIKPVAGFAQGLGEVFDAAVRVWLSGHSGELSFQTGHTGAMNRN